MRFPSMRARVRALSLCASALLLGFLSLGFLAQGFKIEGATSAVGAVGLAQLLHEGRQARTAAELARFEAGAAKAAVKRCVDPFANLKHVPCRCSDSPSSAENHSADRAYGDPSSVPLHPAFTNDGSAHTVAHEVRAGVNQGLPPVKSDPLLEILAGIDRRGRSRIESQVGRVVQGLADRPTDSVPPAVFA